METIELAPASDCVALNIPAGQWHTVEALKSGTVIIEVKDGAYRPLDEDEIFHPGNIKKYEKTRKSHTETTEITDMTISERLKEFMENEARSCSMDYGCITPEYVYRMWGGTVTLEDIEAALVKIKFPGR